MRGVAVCSRILHFLIRVLCKAVAERPVLLLDLDQVYKDILAPHAQALVKLICDLEALFLRNRPTGIHRDLDEDHIGRPIDPTEVGVSNDLSRGMFGDDLKTIAFRGFELRHH